MRSSSSRPEQRSPITGPTRFGAGIPTISVGFLTYAASTAFDSGFLHGFLQGATIALMVIGTYLLGARRWFPRKDDEDLRDGKQWLPSRDGRADGTR